MSYQQPRNLLFARLEHSTILFNGVEKTKFSENIQQVQLGQRAPSVAFPCVGGVSGMGLPSPSSSSSSFQFIEDAEKIYALIIIAEAEEQN
jgi:hypothetical protein